MTCTSLAILRVCMVCLHLGLCRCIHSYHIQRNCLNAVSLHRAKDTDGSSGNWLPHLLIMYVFWWCPALLLHKRKKEKKSHKEPQKRQGPLHLSWTTSKMFHKGRPKSSSGPVGFQKPSRSQRGTCWSHHTCTVKCNLRYSELLTCHITRAANPGAPR